MTYRTGPCVFCSRPAAEACARCAAPTCTIHGASGLAHCRMCARELEDDLEVIRFRYAVLEPDRSDHGLFAPRETGWSAAMWIFDRISRALHERRAHKVFARRTQADIDAWRRGAGIAARRYGG